ncbi:MAG: GNAT family N-acetyltransferase [Bacteroidota bacterium]
MFETFPILHTDRLDLIEIKQEHTGDLFKIFGDERIAPFCAVLTWQEESEAQKLIDKFQKRFADKIGIRWGIALKGESNIIGTIGFNYFNKRHRANIGYDMQVAHWNKGYLTEALQTVIEFGFTQLDINRIEAEVMQDNIASEKVLTKLGFKKEGVLRQWMYWNEKHYDMTMFSLLQSEFATLMNKDIQ